MASDIFDLMVNEEKKKFNSRMSEEEGKGRQTDSVMSVSLPDLYSLLN